MPGALVVLAIWLAVVFLFFVALLVMASVLAKRFGQEVKSVSLSPTRGITAEFYNSERTST